MELNELETIAALLIDVVHLHPLEDVDAGALTLFRWHTQAVWRANPSGSILPQAGALSTN